MHPNHWTSFLVVLKIMFLPRLIQIQPMSTNFDKKLTNVINMYVKILLPLSSDSAVDITNNTNRLR